MTGRYKAYPEYKESGVEWLGKVPQNWSIHSLKRTIDRVTNGIWGSEPDSENDLIVLRVADFNRNQLNISDDKLTFRAIEPKDRASRLLKKGDLLIEKSGGGDKTLVGCVVLFDKDYPAVTSNFVAKMTPKKGFDSSFLRYAFSQLYTGKVNFPSIKQTTGIQNLDSDAYLQESFVFSSYEEQQKIANFLDHETAKIDTLITKQEKLIELLKEKRQAVISHAVTKGLNPDAPMKDSGVEWLGEVPEHWVQVPLKHLASIRYGIGEPPKYREAGTPLIRATNIRSGLISETNLVLVNPDDIPEKRIVWLNEGDIIVVRSGAGTGDSSIIPSEYAGSIAGFDMVVKPKGCVPRFLAHALLSNYIRNNQIDLEKTRAAQPHLNAEELGECFVLLPTLQEQNEISNNIEKQCLKLDKIINKASSAIDLMKERKTALISAAVTGKIDVRDWIASDEVTNG
ncbi:restriction endonuclease subunit S [Photobacterium damselae subsp. damselae]